MAPLVRTSTQVGFVDFNKRMRLLGQRVYRRSNGGVKELALQIVENLVEDTPKKTGQAASNWQVGLQARPTEFKEGYTDISAALIASQTTIMKRQAGQPVFIVNNAPYIGELNRGSSKQAPAAFIEKSVQRARTFIEHYRLLKDG